MKKLIMVLLGILLAVPVLVTAGDVLSSPAGANKDAAHHNEEGISHFKEGHWSVAEKHFREAVKADPNFAEAHYNLAVSLDKEGKHKEAAEEFHKASTLAPDNKSIQDSEILKHHMHM